MPDPAFFRHCIGVFQGGGARGLAFAGSYSAATKSGVKFVGTAGASAGSIAAVLIAAGLKPQDILKELGMPLTSLREPVSNPPRLGQRVIRYAARSVGDLPGRAADWLYTLGEHSSAPIQSWINQTLRRYLPSAPDPVLFRHLPHPVAILATDVRSGNPKVWSSIETPNAPVGFAVRASCSIPLYFQPVEGEDSFLLDGGVLANLPVFLVPRLQLRKSLPILCFRLTSSKQYVRPQTGIDLLKGLVSTLINGATSIQLSLAPSVFTIDIDTKNVEATDFDLGDAVKADLVSSGESSFHDFLKKEALTVRRPPFLQGREELLLETACHLRESAGPAFIMAGDLSWLRELFPILLEIRLALRAVSILYQSGSSAVPDEVRAACVAIGATVRSVPTVPFVGTFTSMTQDTKKLLIVDKRPDYHGTQVRLDTDPALYKALEILRDQYWTGATVVSEGGSKPVLSPLDQGSVLAALRAGVPQYSNAAVHMEKIAIASTLPLSKYIEEYKLYRAESLEMLLYSQGLARGGRVNGAPWVMTPVVVERQGGKLIVIDGTHRIYHSLSKQIEQMEVVVIDGAAGPLPARPLQSWEEVKLVSHRVGRQDRYEAFQADAFRPIREALQSLAVFSI